MIDIYIYGNECTLWDPKDIYECRDKYKITGGLIGTYFTNNKVNGDVNSIPLILSNFEVTLGLEKGWFRLIKVPNEFPTPNPTDLEQLFKDRCIKSQETLEKKEIERKKKEIEFRNKNQKSKDSSTTTNTTTTSTTNIPDNLDQKPLINNKEKVNTIDLNQIDVYIHNSIKDSLEKEPVFKRWKNMDLVEVIDCGGDLEKIKEIWKFPESLKEKINYRVYKDLWEKGYFITGGSKFGGNFLAYKGDPFLYHSTFIVIVREYQHEFTSLDLITSTRLSVNVNKTILLASIDKDDKVIYISVKWRGVT